MGKGTALLEDCDDYVDYTRLGRLPPGAPAFRFTEHDYPIVQLGELYCRDPVYDGLCGAVYNARKNLMDHIERRHGALREHRPSRIGRRRLSDDLVRAQRFYETMVESEDDDEDVDDMNDDDEDDDDEDQDMTEDESPLHEPSPELVVLSTPQQSRISERDSEVKQEITQSASLWRTPLLSVDSLSIKPEPERDNASEPDNGSGPGRRSEEGERSEDLCHINMGDVESTDDSASPKSDSLASQHQEVVDTSSQASKRPESEQSAKGSSRSTASRSSTLQSVQNTEQEDLEDELEDLAIDRSKNKLHQEAEDKKFKLQLEKLDLRLKTRRSKLKYKLKAQDLLRRHKQLKRRLRRLVK